MRQKLKILAVLLWSVSLFLPTIVTQDGGVLIGIEVLLRGFSPFLYIFFFFLPLHLLAFLSNFLMLKAITTLMSKEMRREEWKPPIAITAMFGVNMTIALTAYGPPEKNILLPGLLVLPGYYVWLASFLILMVACYVEDDFSEPRRRL